MGTGRGQTWLPALALGLLGSAAAPPEKVVLAVIVHPKNPAASLSFRDLRAALKLERQFWEGGRRIALYLPPSGAPERKLLLEKIYKMSNAELQKFWVNKVFSGEIPSSPSVARTPEAAGDLVRQNEGGIAIVPAAKVPRGVKVLQVDGKSPVDKDYPLAGVVEPAVGVE